MTALADGTKIQYRKVGKGAVQSHACPPDRPCDGYVEPVHRYWVLFVTGPYKGQGRLVWVRDDDALAAAAEPGPE